ncbi:CHAT domain-containing protein [Nocardia sp. NPDC127526]|uniref:CHAT domain-containing protein n=1 Tax=Nocardia sp. NPDC127526 TaxID=3345393 RepID=UPI00363D39FE
MTADPARRLKARLDCFAAEQDPAIVRDSRAAAEAAEIMAAIGDQIAEHAEAAALVGLLRWYRFQYLPEPDCEVELDEMIRIFGVLAGHRPDLIPRSVLSQLRPPAAADSISTLMLLAAEFLEEHRQTGAVDALDAAATTLYRALSSWPEDERLAGLAVEVLRCYEQLVSRNRMPDTRPGPNPSGRESPRRDVMIGLAQMLGTWVAGATVAGHPSEIIDAGQSGITVESPDQDAMLTVGGVSATVKNLRANSAVAENTRVLRESVDLLRHMVTLIPHDERAVPHIQFNLALALLALYRRTGQMTMLEEAVRLSREALTSGLEAERDRADRLLLLAVALFAQYERTRILGVLEEAVRTFRKAIGGYSHADVRRAEALTNLAPMLHELHRRTGDMAVLDEAILVSRTAVEALPSANVRRDEALANLALVLLTRGELIGMPADLDEALTASREASRLTSRHHPEFPERLSNLALVLRARFRRTHDSADLDEAISCAREALTSIPADHPSRSRHLTNLALMFQTRYEAEGDPSLLREGLHLARLAVEGEAPDHPDKTGLLMNLGGALAQFGVHTNSADACTEAIAVFTQIHEAPNVSWSMQATAAISVGELAAHTGDWHLATQGFERAIYTVSTVARRISDDDGEIHLTRFSGVSADAVASALNAGEVGEAVALFERGRGVLYSRAMDLRSDLVELAGVAPDLARRLTDLQQQLQADVKNRALLTREWNSLIDRVRSLPGFENFLTAPSLDEMLQASAEGPIVLLNVSRYRSDAIALINSTIRVIPLPLLTPESVEGQHSQLTTALHEAGYGPTSARRAAAGHVSRVLEWLWDSAVGPVLDELGLIGSFGKAQRLPRVWWCPSGLLSFFPLHAAGYQLERNRNALDRAVSSYTPTVRALVHGRRNTGNPPSQLLAVSVPDATGMDRLPFATREVEILAEHFPGATRELSSMAATRKAVLDSLPQTNMVHFACHGVADPDAPASGGLQLADGRLTVREISRINMRSADLVYLSACSTAQSSLELPDEAINLASAFLLAGYHNVVANLWDVVDRAAVEIAMSFYEHLSRASMVTGNEVAAALHAAIRNMRDKHSTTPTLWAGTTHIGP